MYRKLASCYRLYLSVSVHILTELYCSCRKLGSNVLLKQPALNCYRCVRLALRSANVLQVTISVRQISDYNRANTYG